MTNNELIDMLRQRGFTIKSASSTIDNISAESLRTELGAKPKEEAVQKENKNAQPKAAEAKKKQAPRSTLQPKREAQKAKEKNTDDYSKDKGKTPGIKLPPGAFVKTKKEVEQSNQGKQRGPIGMISLKLPPSRGNSRNDRAKKKEKKNTDTPQLSRQPAQPPKAPSLPKVSGPKPPPKASIPTIRPVVPRSDPQKVEETKGAELKVIQLKGPIVVRDLANHLKVKPFRLISELMEQGIFASMNQVIDEQVASQLAKKYGFALDIRHRGEAAAKPQPKKEVVQESYPLEPRPPVVCILGHVDHGKTTLLDTIRNANQVAKEAGGITQHIGSYQIEYNKKKISFIDTPGHAAFSKMRKRGADVTDIAILVVAADDGFKPQTKEALEYARAFDVPIIVAINKIDAPGANLDRVKQQMQEHDLMPEEWGGQTITVAVSALKAEGINELLEMILLQSEIMELKAPSKGPVEGLVIESQKEVGRGSTASIIVQRGTLKKGDALVCGEHYCKIRSLVDDRGKTIKNASPATPVKIIGWSSTPSSGSRIISVANERIAKKEAEANAQAKKYEEAEAQVKEKEAGKSALELLFANIEKEQKKTFRAIVKSDVYGTAEALGASLEQIESDKIDIEVVDVSVGAVNKNDVQLASAANAAIIGFNVTSESGVGPLAKHHDVTIVTHKIIYELIDRVKDLMTDMLEPELREQEWGTAEVRQVFSLSKGIVAGSFVTDGKIGRDAFARLIRGKKVIEQGKIVTLKRFKEDVGEVKSGYECGIRIQGVDDYREKDVIQCFVIEKIKPSL